MTEEICSQGHVIQAGALTCSRCGGRSIGTTEAAPILDEEESTIEDTDIDAGLEEDLEEEESDLSLENYEELTVAELQVALEDRGIEFDSTDLKADLQKKLKKALKAEIL